MQFEIDEDDVAILRTWRGGSYCAHDSVLDFVDRIIDAWHERGDDKFTNAESVAKHDAETDRGEVERDE